MLMVTSVFEKDRFIPDKPVSIPQKKKVTVTIDEDISVAAKQTTRRIIFDKCRLDLIDFKFNRNEENGKLLLTKTHSDK